MEDAKLIRDDFFREQGRFDVDAPRGDGIGRFKQEIHRYVRVLGKDHFLPLDFGNGHDAGGVFRREEVPVVRQSGKGNADNVFELAVRAAAQADGHLLSDFKGGAVARNIHTVGCFLCVSRYGNYAKK